MTAFLLNFPLIAALSAIIFAQVIKVPIRLIVARDFKPNLIFVTGSMPSSHSAAVSTLTPSIGISEGVFSGLFEIAFILSVIPIFDASGVRREQGKHTKKFNQLVKNFKKLIDKEINWQEKESYEK